MGDFDQSAHFAAKADEAVVPRRLLAGSGLELLFREWHDTRSLSLPDGTERIADLMAALDDPAAPDAPWLMVLELQAQIDPEKLEVTLEEVANLRRRARQGPDGKGKYKVVAGLVYLVGRCPEELLDMTLPDGRGTRHSPLVWNVAEDDALGSIEAVAKGQLSWGMLFWVVLMRGGGDEAAVARWKEVVAATVADRGMRGSLAGIALVFAELAGRRPQWVRGLEGWDMIESQVVNEWRREGETKGRLEERRQSVLEVLQERFPGGIPNEVTQLIREQESLDLLKDWRRAAARASTFEEFMTVLKH